MNGLQRDVPVLSPRTGNFLVLEQLQVLTQPTSRGGWVNNVIDKPSLRGNHWVCKSLSVLHSLLFNVLALEDNLHSTLEWWKRREEKRIESNNNIVIVMVVE